MAPRTTLHMVGLGLLAMAVAGSSARGQEPAAISTPPSVPTTTPSTAAPTADSSPTDSTPTTPTTPTPPVERPSRAGESNSDAVLPGAAVRLAPTDAAPIPSINALTGDATAVASRKGELVVAPIPSYEPSQGFTLMVVGQYLFHHDANDLVSPPSMVALAVAGTQEESVIGGGGYMGYLDEDRWRIAAAGGVGRVNYDFFGIGNNAAEFDRSIGVQQDFYGGLAQVTHQVLPNFYIGPRAIGMRTDADLDFSNVPFPIPDNQPISNMVALGVKVQYDTRDDTLYPTTGTLAEGQADFYSEAFGGDYTYESVQLAWNQYVPVVERGTLALRAFARSTSGDAPFFALASFGQGADLRGYQAGKYRDKMLADVQAEYRHLIGERWGVAAFAGVGQVFPSFSDIDTDDLLWSVGVGARYKLAKDHPVYYRGDVAWGEDGVVLYLSVGQAF